MTIQLLEDLGLEIVPEIDDKKARFALKRPGEETDIGAAKVILPPYHPDFKKRLPIELHEDLFFGFFDVIAGYRKMGLGDLLLEQAKQLALERQRRLFLFSCPLDDYNSNQQRNLQPLARNQLKRFYEKRGFVPWKQYHIFYGNCGGLS